MTKSKGIKINGLIKFDTNTIQKKQNKDNSPGKLSLQTIKN